MRIIFVDKLTKRSELMIIIVYVKTYEFKGLKESYI